MRKIVKATIALKGYSTLKYFIKRSPAPAITQGLREKALHEVSMMLMKAKTADEVREIVAKGIAKALKFERTFTYAWDGQKLIAQKQIVKWDKNGEPVYEDRQQSAFLGGKVLTEKDSKVWKEAIAKKKMQSINNPQDDRRCDPEKVKRDGTGPFIVVPLVVREKVIDLFSINKGKSGEPFNKQDERLIQTLVNQAAARLENIEQTAALKANEEMNVLLIHRLKEESARAGRKARIAEQFSMAAGAITKGLNPKEKLQAIVKKLVLHSNDIDAAALRIYDKKTNKLIVVASEGMGDEYMGKVGEINPGHGVSGEAFEKEHLVIVGDLKTERRIGYSHALEAGFRAQAVQPFIVGGKTAGLINIYSKKPGAFKKEDLFIPFANFANQVSAAIENAQLYKKTLAEATIDGLTGAFVRRYLMERLGGILAIARQQGKKVSSIMIDIDYFKRKNDEYGHQYGDFVLKTLVKIIKWSIKGGDILGRYGGEEFFLVLPDTDKKGLRIVMEHIMKNIRGRQKEFHQVEGIPLKNELDSNEKVTISMGGVTFPGDGRKMKELIGKADNAMYLAKEQGRDKFVIVGEDQIRKEFFLWTLLKKVWQIGKKGKNKGKK